MVYIGKLEFRYRGMLLSHMASPNVEELHKMAEAIGMRREWFQDKPGRPHYDVSKGRKLQAVKLGAIVVDDKELIRKCFPGLKKVV